MGLSESAVSKLTCPKCSGRLQQSPQTLACLDCSSKFPIWGHIPWLFTQAEAWSADWGQRFRFYILTIQNEIQSLKHELKFSGLLPKTEERLHRLVQAKTEHKRELEKLFAPLTIAQGASFEQLLATGTPLPEKQQLMGYYSNVLRDWGWGADENEAAVTLLEGLLGPEPLGTLLVLGSGPSRLAYDLHRRYPGTETIAVDINPFYLLVAERMLAGKTLHMQEFPIAPAHLKATAMPVKCKAPEPITKNFSLLMADAMNPCFQAGSMDTVLTPWLIDIVPQDFRSFAKKINAILKPGARWLNFGSLVFHQRLQYLCYSRDEIPDVLEEAGFELLRVEEPELPYLCSPHSCQARQEKIFSFIARKVREVDPGPPFAELPSWLDNIDQSIAISPEMQQQTLVNLSLAQILTQVDGQRSLRQIAEELAPHFALPVADMLPMLKRVFAKFITTRSQGQNF